MGRQFDDLAKALASGVSRREALRRFAAGAVGGALAAVIPGRVAAQGGGNSACAQICGAVYPPGRARGRCVSASAKCPPGACSRLVIDEEAEGCFSLPDAAITCVKQCRKVTGGDPNDFIACLEVAEICSPGTCPDAFHVNATEQGLVCVPA